MSFEEQLEESQTVARMGALARGDRGSITVTFAADTGPHTVTVPHRVGVVPSIISFEIDGAPGAGIVIGAHVASKTATQFVAHVTSSAVLTGTFTIGWKAEA